MRYTLIADGTSDAVLLPILTWSLKRHNVNQVSEQWADIARIPSRPSKQEQYRMILDLYPCDVLFVHRDAEAAPPDSRRAEIALNLSEMSIPHVPVVPIRMTEAWLLADEKAIRSAAGNPSGSAKLNLPRLGRLEELTDPKRVLHEALVAASGLGARRRAHLPIHKRVRLIPNFIDDYSRLDTLAAFRRLQQDIRDLVK